MSTLKSSETGAFLSDLLQDRNDARAEIVTGKLDLRELAIPELNAAGTTRYRDIPPSEQLVVEQLVDLNNYGFNTRPDYYSDEARTNPVYGEAFASASPAILMLEGLAVRLADANDTLRRNYGLEFEPMNGFRPLAVQRQILDCFYRAGEVKFREQFSGEALQAKALDFALTYASKPPEKVTLDDSTSWYAHGTGAAIDMLLRTDKGSRLEFGVIFDDPDNASHIRAKENFEGDPTASQSAFRANRRVLFWSMASAGFVNYPEEFFHYDPFQVGNKVTQFGILNAGIWGVPGAAALRATVPAAREALTK